MLGRVHNRRRPDSYAVLGSVPAQSKCRGVDSKAYGRAEEEGRGRRGGGLIYSSSLSSDSGSTTQVNIALLPKPINTSESRLELDSSCTKDSFVSCVASQTSNYHIHSNEAEEECLRGANPVKCRRAIATYLGADCALTAFHWWNSEVGEMPDFR